MYNYNLNGSLLLYNILYIKLRKTIESDDWLYAMKQFVQLFLLNKKDLNYVADY